MLDFDFGAQKIGASRLQDGALQKLLAKNGMSTRKLAAPETGWIDGWMPRMR